MMNNTRLDKKVVELGLFNTRSKAQEAIINEVISCNGKVVTKCSYLVNESDKIELVKEPLKYVSRAGLKLEKAIKEFKIDLSNRVMIDIGASTGGFCDCALKNDVKKIYAIDVGTNQLDNRIKSDDRVISYEKCDFRRIDTALIQDAVIITIDVSFISVTKLIDKISKLDNVKEIVCLIKPQFECGKDIADKYKGIILNKTVHKSVISNIISSFRTILFYPLGLTSSPIRGGSGNIEYLLYLSKDREGKINIDDVVENTF